MENANGIKNLTNLISKNQKKKNGPNSQRTRITRKGRIEKIASQICE